MTYEDVSVEDDGDGDDPVGEYEDLKYDVGHHAVVQVAPNLGNKNAVVQVAPNLSNNTVGEFLVVLKQPKEPGKMSTFKKTRKYFVFAFTHPPTPKNEKFMEN